MYLTISLTTSTSTSSMSTLLSLLSLVSRVSMLLKTGDLARRMKEWALISSSLHSSTMSMVAVSTTILATSLPTASRHEVTITGSGISSLVAPELLG